MVDPGRGSRPLGEHPQRNEPSGRGVALHPQVVALLRVMVEAGEPEPADLAADRAAYLRDGLRLGGLAEPVAGVEDVLVASGEDQLPARLYAPRHAPEADGLLVWLHGGGWYVGDIATFDRVARSLANACGQKVLMVEYRLAPEHRFPAQADDAAAALRWARTPEGARRLGVAADRVVIGGDSAGGQLAVLAALRARDDDLPAPAAQLLVYPALDPRQEGESHTAFAEGPMLTGAVMRECWDRYLHGADPAQADVLRDRDLGGLPPAWVAVAGHDPVRDDGLCYAALLRDAGVVAHERVFGDMVHGFLRWGGVADRTRELVDWLGDAARAALGGGESEPRSE